MRHAKSAYPDGVADHDRPLAARGQREAALAGQWIEADLPDVQEILTSTATRARETAARTGVQAPTREAAEIYDASPSEILQQIRNTDPDVQVLLVVGHAPGIPGLAIGLAGSASDAAAVAQVDRRFPTSALAVLEVPGAWSTLDAGHARLVAMQVPRD